MLIDEEVYLEHYGIPGMKWGTRRAQKSLSGPSAKLGYKIGKNIKETRESRERNKMLNKVSREVDKKKTDAMISKARGEVASGKTKADYKKAKAKYAANKEQLGSREAKKILRKAKDKRADTVYKSQLAKSGQEKVILGLTAAGMIAMGVFSLAAAKM